MAHIGFYKQADQDLQALSKQWQPTDNEALGRKSSYITQAAWLTQQSTIINVHNAVITNLQYIFRLDF